MERDEKEREEQRVGKEKGRGERERAVHLMVARN